MSLTSSAINYIRVCFGGFHKPVVLKRYDDGIQKQIAFLESQQSSKENDKELKNRKKGAEGEANVLFQLEHSGVGMYILHGIHVEDAQIDFVVVTRGWIYFIESKNWSGDWKICKDGTVLVNGKSPYKESPFTQNQRHIDTAKQRWREKNSKVANILLGSKFEKLWYKPLIVVSNYKSTLDTSEAPKNEKEHIVKADQLVAYIKNDLKKYGSRQPFTSPKVMKKIADSFINAEKEHSEQNKTQKPNKSQPLNNSYNWQQSQNKFKRNLQDFCRQQGKLEGKSPSAILTNQDIYMICLHNYSDPNELKKVPISQAKKEKYGPAVIAAYNDAFGK